MISSGSSGAMAAILGLACRGKPPGADDQPLYNDQIWREGVLIWIEILVNIKNHNAFNLHSITAVIHGFSIDKIWFQHYKSLLNASITL